MPKNLFPFESKVSPAIQAADWEKGLLTFKDGEAYFINIVDFNSDVSENFQVKRSFDEDVYITTFGQQLSPINLTGLYIPLTCDEADKGLSPELKKFYNQKRASKGTLVQVTTAKITYKCFLVQLRMNFTLVNNAQAIQFNIKLLGLPIL